MLTFKMTDLPVASEAGDEGQHRRIYDYNIRAPGGRGPKKGYSAAALFGETNFGRKAAKFGRAQNQRPKIRHGVEPSCAL
jgi:hypothetical protein